MLKLIILIFSVAVILSCTYIRMKGSLEIDFSSPVSTLETFRQATLQEKWTAASKCFSGEIREKNSKHLNDEKIYTINFWNHGRGVESIINNSPPLIEKDVTFNLDSSDGNEAIVNLVYPKYKEKAVRLHSLKLKNENGKWKISEVFGKTKGIVP